MLCRLHAVRPSYLLHLFIAHSAIIEDLFNISSLSHFLYSLDNFLADAKTDEVLGVHMIGARCADLIAEAVTAMEFRASAEDISRMSHAHPTFAEAIKEAALAATENRALHV